MSEPITFLLTDVEGSTKLWEREPEAMSAALIRHDEIVGDVIARHGGTLVKSKGEGDSSFSIFTDPVAAVAAALEMQRVLERELWKTSKPIRVRAALHTGEAQPRDGDWYGPTVNRCARLRGAGHGRQVLVSDATRALVDGSLPSGASLRDLGVRRLKDLSDPQPVYQLVHPDLPATFPPLVTLDVRQHNLPVAPAELVGREVEAHRIREQITGPVRMLTLTGPGGVGKTRLALHAAADCVDDFRDGVWFVPLAAIDDPALVADATARALQIPEPPDGDAAAAVIAHLRDHETLVVFDNFEHVTEGALFVSDILASCARVRVIVTSREWLFLRGEHDFPVPPLMSDEAVELFGRRAGAADPSFVIHHADHAKVAELCERLDRLPLAIELVAARVRDTTLDELIAAFPLESASLGARDLPARQRTLRHAIAWSYDRLDPSEQAVLRALATFAGGCEPEAAEAVAGPAVGDDSAATGVAAVAARLAAKSLLRIETGAAGIVRYSMLTTVRDFAGEQAREHGEDSTNAARHAAHFDLYAARADDALAGGSEPGWLTRLEDDHPNLRLALTWSECHPDLGLRLAGHLARFWWQQGHWHEARQWFTTVLAREGSDEWRAGALLGAGYLAGLQGDLATAGAMLDECVVRADATGRTETAARAEMVRGELLALTDPDGARRACEVALSRFEDCSSASGTAQALNNLGRIAFQRGDLDDARDRFERALRIHEETANQRGVLTATNNLAQVLMRTGDPVAAASRLRANLEIARRFGDTVAASTMLALGNALAASGDLAGARVQFESVAETGDRLGDDEMTRMALVNTASIARMLGDLTGARQCREQTRLISARLGDREGEAFAFADLARLAFEEGEAAISQRYAREAIAVGADHRDLRYAAAVVMRGTTDPAMAAARRALAELITSDDPEAATVLLAAAQHGDAGATAGCQALLSELRDRLGAGFGTAWQRGIAASDDDLAGAAAALIERATRAAAGG